MIRSLATFSNAWPGPLAAWAHFRSDFGETRQPSLFPPPDVYQHDLCASRHRGAPTSVAAHDKIKNHKRAIYTRILGVVRSRGAAGCTVKELATALETLPNKISGRLTELRAIGELTFALDAAGKIIRRDGSNALVATNDG